MTWKTWVCVGAGLMGLGFVGLALTGWPSDLVAVALGAAVGALASVPLALVILASLRAGQPARPDQVIDAHARELDRPAIEAPKVTR